MENFEHATTTHSTTRGRYVGPSAARIADLVAPRQRVRFERGWFWTAAVCHGSEQDLAAFRQRPDGDGIDVRCKSAGCSRQRVIRSLEQLTGESIWSAYTAEPGGSTASQATAGRTDGTGSRSWCLVLAPFIVLLVAAPLVLGADLQLTLLNTVGLIWVGWLGRHVMLNRRRAAAKAGRPR